MIKRSINPYDLPTKTHGWNIRRLAKYASWSFWVPAILIFVTLLSGTRTTAQRQNGYIRDVQEMETAEELGIASPVGLAYLPQAGVLGVINSQAKGASGPLLGEMDMYGRLVGKATWSTQFSDPVNAAFNAKKNSLFHLNQTC